jgi:mannose-1-phosphate guanylyltransferase
MKAFLLAAGFGTRLRPLTLDTPKCLVPVCGKPMLFWWLKLFEKYQINEVLINLHYLSDKVKEYIIKNAGAIKFTFFEEEVLLGSAGTLRENKKFVSGEDNFFIMYADNLTNCNLEAFYKFHTSHDQPFSMVLFRTDSPKTKGIVELDNNKTVISFVEKPKEPRSNLANAGIYIAEPEALDLIPATETADIGFDLLPKLVSRMSGWETGEYLTDIGSADSLLRAEKDWARIIKAGF